MLAGVCVTQGVVDIRCTPLGGFFGAASLLSSTSSSASSSWLLDSSIGTAFTCTGSLIVTRDELP